MTNLEKKNKIEYLGFVRLLSDHVSSETNELQVNNEPMLQKDIIELSGFSRKKVNAIMTDLSHLLIIVDKFNEEDSRVKNYYFHPYIYFQGKLNLSLLSAMLEIVEDLEKPYKYLTVKENDVLYDLINSISEKPTRYIYFIENLFNSEIKLGVSSDIDTRLKQISSDIKSPVKLIKLINGDEQKEKELHKRFSNDRVHGEWFKPSDELLDFIKII